jgi:hypothetical protein
VNAFVLEPGSDTYASGPTLEAGEYIMICFVPVGTKTEEDFFAAVQSDGEPTSPPHFTRGMVREFTVE